MHALLARIDAVNPRVNTIVTLARESALSAARRATAALGRGARLGPLHGVPVAIKDVTPTRGLRTTYGSTLFAEHVPDVDAVVVERLRAAGAIVIGKTNTPEFAFGPNTVPCGFTRSGLPVGLQLVGRGGHGAPRRRRLRDRAPLGRVPPARHERRVGLHRSDPGARAYNGPRR